MSKPLFDSIQDWPFPLQIHLQFPEHPPLSPSRKGPHSSTSLHVQHHTALQRATLLFPCISANCILFLCEGSRIPPEDDEAQGDICHSLCSHEQVFCQENFPAAVWLSSGRAGTSWLHKKWQMSQFRSQPQRATYFHVLQLWLSGFRVRTVGSLWQLLNRRTFTKVGRRKHLSSLFSVPLPVPCMFARQQRLLWRHTTFVTLASRVAWRIWWGSNQ